jgi:NTE family protein
MHAMSKLRIGLALGSGSARGWAHIGVLQVLREAGWQPDVVCGTSIGALVGAAYVAEQLDRLQAWVESLRWQTVVRLLDIRGSGGLIKGALITDFLRSQFHERRIEDLPRRFAAVATELATGREVWLQSGYVVEAVRASIAIPGVFAPTRHDGRLLLDGALVNPVPVSLCRALGADVVIAVDLNADLLGSHLRDRGRASDAPSDDMTTTEPSQVASVFARLQRGLLRFKSSPATQETPIPSIVDVIAGSVNIMQVRITRSRLAGEPADVLIQPRLAHIAFMDFHRGPAAIEEGRRAAREAVEALEAFRVR